MGLALPRARKNSTWLLAGMTETHGETRIMQDPATSSSARNGSRP